MYHLVGFQNYLARPFVALKGHNISFKGQGHSAHINCEYNENWSVSYLCQRADCKINASQFDLYFKVL